MNLSDLTPKRQEEIVEQRIADMKAFTEHTLKSRDPLCWMTLELDSQARREGVNMEYQESLDESEDEIE